METAQTNFGTPQPEPVSYVAAYVGIVVPDSEEYRNEGFSRAGNMSQINLLKSLIKAGVCFTLIISFVPIPAYPQGKKIYISKKRITLFECCEALLLPFFNVMPFKQLHWGWNVFWHLIWWGLKNREEKKLIYVYNLTRPPGIITYAAARLIGAKMVASLFDVGMPPVKIKNMFWYHIDHFFAKWIIPRLDGRVVITERIAEDFAPKKNFLHIDGALGPEVLSHLPPFSPKTKDRTEFVLVFAGRLWEANGVHLILKAFSLLREPGYRLCIAGHGPLREVVIQAAAQDQRIQYFGYLSMDEVMKLYGNGDILLNIRLTSRVKTPYLFPSKLLEYYAVGKIVITTKVAHVQKEYGPFGFVLKEETPEALARLIEYVRELEPSRLGEIGRAARNYILTRKNWTYQGERIARYLSSLFDMQT